MRFIAILIGAALMTGSGARRAEACGDGGGSSVAGPIVGAVILGGAYVSGTATFAIKDIAGHEPSLGYGIVESVFNAPFAVGYGVAFYQAGQSTSHDAMVGLAVMAFVHGALLAHGVSTIVHHSRHHDAPPPKRYDGPPGAMQVGPVTAVVAPTPVRDGAGIGVAGTF